MPKLALDTRIDNETAALTKTPENLCTRYHADIPRQGTWLGRYLRGCWLFYTFSLTGVRDHARRSQSRSGLRGFGLALLSRPFLLPGSQPPPPAACAAGLILRSSR